MKCLCRSRTYLFDAGHAGQPDSDPDEHSSEVVHPFALLIIAASNSSSNDILSLTSYGIISSSPSPVQFCRRHQRRRERVKWKGTPNTHSMWSQAKAIMTVLVNDWKAHWELSSPLVRAGRKFSGSCMQQWWMQCGLVYLIISDVRWEFPGNYCIY